MPFILKLWRKKSKLKCGSHLHPCVSKFHRSCFEDYSASSFDLIGLRSSLPLQDIHKVRCHIQAFYNLTPSCLLLALTADALILLNGFSWLSPHNKVTFLCRISEILFMLWGQNQMPPYLWDPPSIISLRCNHRFNAPDFAATVPKPHWSEFHVTSPGNEGRWGIRELPF